MLSQKHNSQKGINLQEAVYWHMIDKGKQAVRIKSKIDKVVFVGVQVGNEIHVTWSNLKIPPFLGAHSDTRETPPQPFKSNHLAIDADAMQESKIDVQEAKTLDSRGIEPGLAEL